ncbi:MAG: exodeoxyribonuclease large subunit [Subtercola sp.]|nr:exodeoxyribonuclease large subunit [Subtercola sp.]
MADQTDSEARAGNSAGGAPVAFAEGPPTFENPWPIGYFSGKIKAYIDRLGTAWVEGEITQWGVSGGNVYGKLKDTTEEVTIGFNIWSSVRAKIPADLKQGDRVIALVKPNYWLKGGTLTMQVFEMRHVGLGDLLERLERLRRQLASEGLFDESRKKRLPFLPGCIGLITGKDSDAEKDVLRNAQLRWPSVSFRVVHAAVQGDRVAREVASAISALDADPEVDVIIVARGGGDFQNLLGFSDESVIRAAAACRTPLVSAIGHEADRPLLDDVADLRASTPTDAAKRVVPDVSEELNKVEQARARLSLRVTAFVRSEIDRIEQVRSRPVLSNAGWIVDTRAEELTRHVSRGVELMHRVLERAGTATSDLSARLRTLSPQSTLDRGYAIVQQASSGAGSATGGGPAGGHIVRRPADAPLDSSLTITLASGALRARSEGEL